MTPLQRFVHLCIIWNTILNTLGFCGMKAIFEYPLTPVNQQQYLAVPTQTQTLK
jgi:hypothetical protein